MRYAYPCNLVSHESQGDGFVVTFPDIPEAITGAYTKAESIFLAEDALAVALSMYVDNDEAIPTPSQLTEGQIAIALPPIVAAKLALYTAMRKQGISRAELAERLSVSEKTACKLIDPDYDSHMTSVMNALKAVGRRLIVEDTAA